MLNGFGPSNDSNENPSKGDKLPMLNNDNKNNSMQSNNNLLATPSGDNSPSMGGNNDTPQEFA